MAGYDFARKCINIYETWDRSNTGWCEYRIREYTDGSATREFVKGPLSEKEYFKLTLEGRT